MALKRQGFDRLVKRKQLGAQGLYTEQRAEGRLQADPLEAEEAGTRGRFTLSQEGVHRFAAEVRQKTKKRDGGLPNTK